MGCCLELVEDCCFCAAPLEGGLARDGRDDDSSSSGLLRFSPRSALVVLLFCLSSERRVTGPAVDVPSPSLALFVCPLLAAFCGDVPLLLLATFGPKNSGNGKVGT